MRTSPWKVRKTQRLRLPSLTKTFHVVSFRSTELVRRQGARGRRGGRNRQGAKSAKAGGKKTKACKSLHSVPSASLGASGPLREPLGSDSSFGFRQWSVATDYGRANRFRNRHFLSLLLTSCGARRESENRRAHAPGAELAETERSAMRDEGLGGLGSSFGFRHPPAPRRANGQEPIAKGRIRYICTVVMARA
jgi:hypothetical protein